MGEVDLPKSLFDKPLLGCFFWDFHGSEAFAVALWAAVDFAGQAWSPFDEEIFYTREKSKENEKPGS